MPKHKRVGKGTKRFRALAMKMATRGTMAHSSKNKQEIVSTPSGLKIKIRPKE